MSLSILVPIYNNYVSLENFLYKLKKQTQNNYEVVFIIDTNNENVLLSIDKYINFLKGKVVIISNSTRQGRYNVLQKAIASASGEYGIIFSPFDVIKENFVEKINFIINKTKADIIEFNAHFYNMMPLNGDLRQMKNINFQCLTKTIKLNIFAYTYPFEFNKIIKISLLKKTIEYSKIHSQISNSRLSVEILFKCILLANSYYGWDKKITKFKKINENDFMNIIREWEKIIEHKDFSFYKDALEYNKFFSIKFIYQTYAKSLKNKNILLKLNTILKSFDKKTFYDSNVYLLKKNKETEILRK